MIVDDKTLEELEFYPLIDMIKAFSFSEYGRNYFKTLHFDEDPVKRYAMVEEMGKFFEEINVVVSGVEDVSMILKSASEGRNLKPVELIAFSDLFKVSKRISEILLKTEKMRVMGEKLVPPKGFVELCDRIFNPDGTIKDNATPELQKIRKEIRVIENSIDDKMKKLLADGVKSGFTSEVLVVQRHDRYVLPIDASKRSMVRGIIHGQSASGLTYYVEPEEMIELNDALAVARSKESIEISRMLNELSRIIIENHDDIVRMIRTFEEVDGVYARASYGLHNMCVIPQIGENEVVRIIGGRNPLIPANKVVPIDLELNSKDHVTIISGPNTGGKTATLKTVGLFSLMCALGVPIPASAGTSLSKFDVLYSDIGDNQSVRNELSTFSARVLRADEICRVANDKTLILIDEIGEGTEPAEGAAFAKSIIDILISKGSKAIITTHLPELKAIAYMVDGVRNASVGFDIEQMRPTYRIHMDMPGRSRALEIAEKLGISDEIVKRFKENRSVSFSQSDQLIEKLQMRISQYEEKIENLNRREKELEKNEESFKERFEKLKNKEMASLSDEIRSLSQKLFEIKKESEEAIHLVRTSQKEDELVDQDKRIQVLRRKIEEIKKSESKSMDMSVGSYVEIVGTQTYGKVIALRKEKAVVDLGGSQVEISPDMLKISEEPKEQKIENVEYVKNDMLPAQIDIRGMTVEDAIPVVEEFIDRMLKSNSTGFIIHGKGTGKLANGIWSFLRSRHVSFRMGKNGEGGSGVTVVGEDKI